MFNAGENKSREIKAGILEKEYPDLKELINENEIWRAFSKRKPKRFIGVFYILVGLFIAVQMIMHLLISDPKLAIPVLLLSFSLMWFGIWLAVLAKNEYFIITSERIAHQKVDILGRQKKDVVSVSFSDMVNIRFYKDPFIIGNLGNTKGGSVLIKKKSGGTYIVPPLEDSTEILAILIEEASYYKAQHPKSTANGK